MDRDYYSDPRRKLRTALTRAVARPVRSMGFDLEVRSFYSPVPNLALIDPATWNTRSPMTGVPNFDTVDQLAYVERELAGHIAEFRPSSAPTEDRFAFYLGNGLYQGGDADLLYAMIRRHRPKRIIELGAGFSTLVTAAACRANREDGHITEFVSYDPYATPPLTGIDGLTRLEAVTAESVPIADFQALEPGDVLFIDSSHVVRTGGDVNRLLLDVIPAVGPGVVIHVHDIYLPYEYPREWAVNGWYWSEQYLLQALLVGNDSLEVLVAAHAVWRAHGPELQRLIPNLDPAHPPLSFWMRCTG